MQRLFPRLAMACCLCVFVASASAQPMAEPEVSEFWFARDRMKAGVAASIVSMGTQPWMAAAHREMGRAYLIWDELTTATDRAPQLNEEWLSLIKDGTAMPRIAGRLPGEIPREEMAAYNLYGQALVYASQTPAEAFVKSAEDNSDIFFSHLWNAPQKHRGKVVTVRGRLVKLEKLDATLNARKEGVHHLYEGWVFGQTKGATPYCIQFVTLPKNLKPAEQMREEIVFHGYFIKKVKYRGGDGKDHVSPMLIGATARLLNDAELKKEEEASTTPFPITTLIIGSCLVGVVTVLLLAMNRWFRRGDDRTRSELVNIQAQSTIEAMEEAERAMRPPAPPPGNA
ncbi:MAG: hypothetical protein U0744_17450 [Gemmataceae bacterium]